jgi:hypothetical protein
VLTNSTTPAPEAATYALYDRLLGLAPVSWVERFRQAERDGAAAASARARTDSSGGARPPAHDLRDYAGTYEHPGYGTIEVAVSAGELTFRFDRMRTTLRHVRFETFRSDDALERWGIIPNLTSFTVTFRTGVDGRVDGLEVPFEPAVAPITFTRSAP